MQNFNSVAVDVLELLAFNGQKFRVSPSRDPGTPFFLKKIQRSYQDCPWEHTCQI